MITAQAMTVRLLFGAMCTALSSTPRTSSGYQSRAPFLPCRRITVKISSFCEVVLSVIAWYVSVNGRVCFHAQFSPACALSAQGNYRVSTRLPECVECLETEMTSLQGAHATGRERLANPYPMREARKSARACRLRPFVKKLKQLKNAFDASLSERGREALHPPAWTPVKCW